MYNDIAVKEEALKKEDSRVRMDVQDKDNPRYAPIKPAQKEKQEIVKAIVEKVLENLGFKADIIEPGSYESLELLEKNLILKVFKGKLHEADIFEASMLLIADIYNTGIAKQKYFGKPEKMKTLVADNLS